MLFTFQKTYEEEFPKMAKIDKSKNLPKNDLKPRNVKK
jgi:hypothetical protein